MIVEMRIYHCLPGRLPALHDRLIKSTLGLFEKHGIVQIGFWTTLAGPSNHALTYLLQWGSLPGPAPRGTPVQADPEWIEKRAQSDGTQALVERIENPFLAPASYSAL